MFLNSTAQNALRAVLYIAEHGAEVPVRVDDVAASLACPRNYLSKTMHALTRAGVLRSVRGRHGGFQLVDSPRELVLSRVVGPFQPAGERRCLLGRATCGDAHPCLAHHRWSRVASDVETFFGQTTVADLLKKDPATRSI
ncbi:MAG: Rrf2 family transcriptional regulator [Gemmatimonadaceae bacterium]|nr:Rrf2 family transcriptional regulator [Gemmatimonadaceae bacterium]